MPNGVDKNYRRLLFTCTLYRQKFAEWPSQARMPAEFIREVEKLGVGQRSNPFRSHLGFHIVEVSEIRPARLLSFAEARGEIALALADERRALIAKRLADMLSVATYARSD
jgi:parvulin-like peptidyl-prolyl isomerase